MPRLRPTKRQNLTRLNKAYKLTQYKQNVTYWRVMALVICSVTDKNMPVMLAVLLPQEMCSILFNFYDYFDRVSEKKNICPRLRRNFNTFTT